MRLRFDQYKELSGRLQWRSIVWLVTGGLCLAGGSLSGWLGLLMIFMTDGGVWERRSGMFLAVFTGFFPFALGALMVARGLSQRRDLRVLRDLGALARQLPAFSVDDVARVLDVGPARAHRIVLDTITKGILEETQGIAPGPSAGADPAAGDVISGDAKTVADPLARPVSPVVDHEARPVSAPVDSWMGVVLHGTYRIEGHVGAGGMGMVFRARHLRTGRAYAVKTLLPDARLLPDALRRFEREATAASALGHPNIISVHDFNVTPEGIHYLVMDLLEGETLEQRLGRVGSLPWQDAQRLILEVGAGLAAAHEHGLLHRDVKPGNIFLARAGTSERAVLLDFGLVKPSDETAVSRITASGAAIGTPLYMSPEQARGEAVDERSDQYALAAVLFEMVTGAPPFLDRTLASVYAQLLTMEAPSASAVSDRPVPAEVDAVLARALSKAKEARYPAVRALLAAVAAVRIVTAAAAATAATPVATATSTSGIRKPAQPCPRWLVTGPGPLVCWAVMEVDERHKICQLIESMLAADGTISPIERDFLRRVVERFGLPDREGVPFSDSGESDVGRSTNALRSLAPDVRLRVMALLVDAAVVDGVVAPEERALLMASAATLGVEATALEERIAGRLRGGVSVSPRPPLIGE